MDRSYGRTKRKQYGLLSDKSLKQLACRLGGEWYPLAIHLGLTVPELDRIKLDNPYQTVVQTTKALVHWRDLDDSDDAIKTTLLYEALKWVDRCDLVTALQEEYIETADENSIENSFCPEHSNQNIELFCRTCSCAICVTCSRDKHEGHDMMDIKNYAEITVEEFGNSVESVKTQFTCSVIHQRRKLLLAKRSYANNMKASIAFIKHRAEELKAEIDGISGVIIDEMLEFQNKAQTEFHDLELELESMEDRLEELEVLYSSMLKTQKEMRILKLGNVLSSRINQIKSKNINSLKTTVEPPIFSIGEYEHETLQDMFGSCRTKDESGMKRSESLPDSSSIGDVIETKMEVLSSFQYAKNDTIRAIVPCERGKAWITTYGKKEIQMVKKDGDILKTLTLDLRINDIATTNDGGLVLTPNGGAGGRQYQIKKMKPNGDIVDFINMKPLLPCSIEVTKDGYIYAGMVDSYNFNVTDSSVRVVTRFSAFGVIESKFQYDDKGTSSLYTALHDSGKHEL
ncbi:hypothetical protein KUTeg_015263 [Tegillarca granosa]|uniref:B box-type domain-containing protein n=1 Tax=Tegillarca granosa TaxID=220873 RepID=A0ABQ9EPN6_TEGGR|nr:hypothetical protein KUTeg_015263 [Tegillarca granosa]